MEDAGNPMAWQNQGAGMTRKTKMKAHFSPLALRKGRSERPKGLWSEAQKSRFARLFGPNAPTPRGDMKKGKHPRASLANAKIHIVVAKCKCVQNFFDMVFACFCAVARDVPVSRYA